MNQSVSVRRPRASDMLECQASLLVPEARPRRQGSTLARLVTVLMLAAVGVFATAGLAWSDEAGDGGDIGAGTLLFRGAAGDAPAPLVDTNVRIRVSGMVARVSLKQQFHNPGADFVEGVYLFPLPDDSAVDTLTMRIGDRLIVGEIQEKKQARRTYTQARESGQRASLVEQKRPNMFTTEVANIGPGENIEIEIAYLQTMTYRQGEFSLRFPMTITPRYEPPVLAAIAAPGSQSGDSMTRPATGADSGTGVTDQALYRLCDVARAGCNTAQLRVELDAGFPLARVESLYHDMDVVQAGYRYRLQPADGAVPMDRDFELVWQPALGAQPEAAVFTETWKGEAFAMIMLLPPADGGVVHHRPREVVLVIDTSGSMGGTSIRQARDALHFALGRLKPQDRFNVIRFDSDAHALFRQSMPADRGNLRIAGRFVDSLKADGGTEIGAALDLALDEPADRRASADGFLRQVVFVTDGSVGNEHQLFRRIESKLGQTRLFTVGIGSAPNDWFMRKAAQFGRGTFTHIGADHMIEERMEQLLARLESPVLQDIEIDAPAGAEVWPERIQDLYTGEPVLVRARLSSPEGTFTVRANDAYSAWQRSLSLTPGQNSDGVAALWGRSRIEALLDSVVTGADADVVRERVIDLALKHHLVSRYTSLVAVDRTPVRAVGAPLHSQRVALNAPHGSAMLGYPAGATPMAMLALAGALTLLLAAVVALAGQRRQRALLSRLRVLRNGSFDDGAGPFWDWL